ncbi:VWA domain-containing protein [Aquabacterium lacunae]|nr:VWA domain-containing protein [Aquabacterium lacunae]
MSDTPHALNADTHPRVQLSAVRSALQAGHSNVLEVLVRVQGPEVAATAVGAPPAHALARALAIALDASGSMEGRPLAEAKRCAEWLVGRLRPHDRLAVVCFEQSAQLIWPAVEVGNGRAVVQAIRSIETGGATALHDGWHEAATALQGCDVPGLRRVILLSDGEANQGECDPGVIAQHCARWAAQGVSTSTYGLGESFNEELMVAMAREGRGSQYYGHTADDLMLPFEQELQLIDARCMGDVRLSYRVPQGVQVAVLNDLPRHDGVLRLPDVAHGAEAWALLRLTVPAELLPAVGQGLSVLQVTVSGRGAAGDTVLLAPAPLVLPVKAAADWAQCPPDELVQRRLTEVAAAQALERMREAANRGDAAAVQELLRAARAEFGHSDWVQAILASMQQLADREGDVRALSKEMKYSAATLMTRVRASDEQMCLSGGLAEEAVPKFLRRSGLQGRQGQQVA